MKTGRGELFLVNPLDQNISIKRKKENNYEKKE